MSANMRDFAAETVKIGENGTALVTLARPLTKRDRRSDRDMADAHFTGWRSDPIHRFWRKVDKSNESGCWLWTGSSDPAGYGHFYADGKYHGSHRYAYERTHGPIPDGMFVMHVCDNPPCVNPAHLRIGTPRDNTADMIAKGRRTPALELFKLSATDVMAIRRSGAAERATAAQFGISRAQVNRIRAGQAWRHLPMPAREARPRPENAFAPDLSTPISLGFLLKEASRKYGTPTTAAKRIGMDRNRFIRIMRSPEGESLDLLTALRLVHDSGRDPIDAFSALGFGVEVEMMRQLFVVKESK
jgi:hypothetical protein